MPKALFATCYESVGQRVGAGTAVPLSWRPSASPDRDSEFLFSRCAVAVAKAKSASFHSEIRAVSYTHAQGHLAIRAYATLRQQRPSVPTGGRPM